MTTAKKFRAIAIDDDQLSILMIEKIISKIDEIELVSCHNNPVSGLSSLIIEQPDLLLLDIDMPYLSGMEILKILEVLKNAPKTIVISSKAHFEEEVKDMNVVAFCKKPLDQESMVKTLALVMA